MPVAPLKIVYLNGSHEIAKPVDSLSSHHIYWMQSIPVTVQAKARSNSMSP